MNTTIKIIKLFAKAILFTLFSTVLFAAVGCSGSDSPLSVPNLNIDWNAVNESIEASKLSTYGYYMESDYKSGETEYGSVSLYNYDPNDDSAWKNTEYQLDISYGANFKLNSDSGYYDYATITVSLNETGGKDYYTAAYTADGSFIAEEGKWFISDAKEDYLKQKVSDAMEIFGLGE